MNNLDQFRRQELDTIEDATKKVLGFADIDTEHIPGLTLYLRRLLERADALEFGDPKEFLATQYKVQADSSPLQAIWVPPRFRKQALTGADVPLDTLLSEGAPLLVVLANPGNGKSTLARFVACRKIKDFIGERAAHFALYVPLGSLEIGDLTYHEAVVKCAARFVGLERESQVLTALRKTLSSACLIFDGLDELPLYPASTGSRSCPSRIEAVSLIKSYQLNLHPAAASVPSPRLLVTSRITDYYENPNATLGSVPIYYLSEFSFQQMGTAITNWHDCALAQLQSANEYSDERSEVLASRAAAIERTLRDSQDLATVCLTPLFLMAFLSVHADNRDLPTSVSQLCWSAIRWFLIEKHQDSARADFVANNAKLLLETITAIGYLSYSRSISGERKSWTDAQMRECASQALDQSPGFQGDYTLRQTVITHLVGFLRGGHGVIVQLSEDNFEFVHNLFHEVLAGRHLGHMNMADRVKLAEDERWHRPIRYWGGLLTSDARGQYEIAAFISETRALYSDKNLPMLLMQGELLAEVFAALGDRDRSVDVKNHSSRICKLLSEFLEREDVRFADRLRIGDVFASLGDSRLHSMYSDRLVDIPAGKYVIGRNADHLTRIEKYSLCPASPTQSGSIETFRIGSYLVTNEEYKAFMDDEGYSREEFWEGDYARHWALGESSARDELVERAAANAKTHLASELLGNRLVEDDIQERCRQVIHRHAPLFWNDPAHNRSNQPVVGINWWEANAFALWLQTKLRHSNVIDALTSVRLPTEAEWEIAAKLTGDDGRYPWVSGEASANAHARVRLSGENEALCARSCAVGLFQFVQTRLPIYDLVGNVWEWTGSIATPYDKSAFNQSFDHVGLQDRVARGSSWLSSEVESTQITFRSFDPPYNAYEDLGLRLVFSRGATPDE